MATTLTPDPHKKIVSRVIQVGHALYVLMPADICGKAGLKKGDRLAVETDGRVVYLARIPFEELFSQQIRTRVERHENEVRIRPVGYVKERA